jgi:hypothetical protein
MKGLISLAYKDLKTFLGRQDAALGFHELAYRELMRAGQESANKSEYFELLYKIHGIKTNGIDSTVIAREWNRIYVILTMGALERFLFEWRDEVKLPQVDSLFGEDKKLRTIILNILDQNPIGEINILGNLIEYYRLVRNEAAHPYSSSQYIGELKAHHQKISCGPILNFLQTRYNRDTLPSVSYEIDFSDYSLCSRMCKDFALSLSLRYSPPMDDFIASLKWKQRFSASANNPSRYRSRCKNELRTKFCLDDAEADLILSKLKGF